MNRKKMETAEQLVVGLVAHTHLSDLVLNSAHALISEGEPKSAHSITYPIYELQQEFKRLGAKLERLQRDIRQGIESGEPES